MPAIHLIPVPSVDVVDVGDDLSHHLEAALTAAGVTPRDGDVLVVASKVVALAEGAVADARGMPDSDEDPRRAMARAVADHVVADAHQALVVATHHGFVCANAGIDTSNVRDGLLLLPTDPDRSARDLRRHLRHHHGADVAVVVTDTFGRPWRNGQVDVAIGASGLAAVRDERGTRDLHGRVLEVSQVAVADELAAAADLVRTKADGVPFVVVRGLDQVLVPDDGLGAAALVRDARDDLFPAGGPTLWEHATRTARPDRASVDADAVGRVAATDAAGVPVLERAMQVVGPNPTAGCRMEVRDGELWVQGQDAMTVGMALQAVHTVLTGHGWHTRISRVASEDGTTVAVVRPTRRPAAHAPA